jgi:prepilin-type N-terminal cleavage/methylation domain-containing protein
MHKEKGFTVIEISVVIVILLIIGIFFWVQRGDMEATSHDQQRKTAINSLYYGLTEVFYKENGFYPTSINSDNLRGVSPESFVDTNNVAIDSANSEYFYEGINCDKDGKCKSFKLVTSLEKEAEYVREPSE